MRKLLTLATLLACATIGVASAKQAPTSSTQVGQASTTMSGTLTEKAGKFFLTDETSNTTVEVRGEGLAKRAGQKVQLTGQLVPGPTGSPEILIISDNGKKVAAAVVGGKVAAAAGIKAGLSQAAIVGIVGAGSTAATVGSLYAADVIGSSDAPVSRR